MLRKETVLLSNKKGFMITPLLFIAFMIIAIIYSFYVSDIDNQMAASVEKTAHIEKKINDVYDQRINYLTYAKSAVYSCQFNYSAGCSTPNSCMNSYASAMNITLGNICNTSNKVYISSIVLPKIAISETYLNLTADSVTISNITLCKTLLNQIT